MVPSTVLVLDHSFLRRLKSDLKFQLDSRMSPSFKLDGTARVYIHGIDGRTVTKLRKLRNPFRVVARLSPDIVILETGTNGLSFLPPEVVGSEIEELVSQLQQAYRVKVVCVCLITPEHRNHVFNAKRLILNNYLAVVLEHMPKVFTWLHRGFARPPVTSFLRDGVHFNNIGQYNLYRSYRGAILKSLRML